MIFINNSTLVEKYSNYDENIRTFFIYFLILTLLFLLLFITILVIIKITTKLCKNNELNENLLL